MTLREPVGVDVSYRGYLIRFAQGDDGGFYFDPSSGEVLDVSDWPGSQPHLVNSTLERFTSTVQTLINAFPFYDDLGRDLNEADVDTLVAD